MLKKATVTITISLALVFGAVPQSQAAFMGLFPAALGAINSSLFSLLAFGGIVASKEYSEKYYGPLKGIFWGYLALGLIMDSRSDVIQFQPLNIKEAKELNLTDDELESYNSELNRINALMEESILRLSQSTKDNQGSLSKELYENIKSELSPSTFSVVQKLLLQALVGNNFKGNS